MQTRLWREYNYVLLGCVVVLVIFGTVMVYSATLNDSVRRILFSRHLLNVAIGLGAMVALTLLDYRQLAVYSKPLFLGTVTVLALVLVVGGSARARRAGSNWARAPFSPPSRPSWP